MKGELLHIAAIIIFYIAIIACCLRHLEGRRFGAFIVNFKQISYIVKFEQVDIDWVLNSKLIYFYT